MGSGNFFIISISNLLSFYQEYKAEMALKKFSKNINIYSIFKRVQQRSLVYENNMPYNTDSIQPPRVLISCTT